MAWREAVDAESHEFKIALPNTRAGAAFARKQLVHFAKHFRIKREIIADIETVVGEALANAAEHGYRARGTIVVEARVNGSDFEVIISDDGHGFTSHPISADHPAPLSPRGYGLFLMQALVDAIEFRNGGRSVWLLKRI